MKYCNLLLCIAAISSALSVEANIDGTWKYYPSLDIDSGLSSGNANTVGHNNVVYMAEGERYFYCLVSGYVHNKISVLQDNFSESYLFPARLDKNRTDAMVEPLSLSLPLSGTAAEAMEYSQKGKFVAIAYSNLAIDIIFDDGRQFSNTDLARYALKAGIKINAISISADASSIFIGTNFGFIEINSATGLTNRLVNVGTNVNFANRLGSLTLLSTPTAIYAFTDSESPRSLADLHLLKGSEERGAAANLLNSADSSLLNPYMLIPTSESSFIYIGPNTEAANGFSINSVTLLPDSFDCSLLTLASGSIAGSENAMGLSANYYHKFPLEGLLSPSLRGFTFSSPTYFYDVHFEGELPSDDPQDYASRILTLYKKDQTNQTDATKGAERYKHHASLDGINYRIFRPREGFQMRSVAGENNATQWSNVGNIVEVNAPSAMKVGYMDYAPGYGVIMRNIGFDYRFAVSNWIAPSTCTSGVSLMDTAGKWTQLSTRHNYINNALMQSDMSARGVAVDPCDPKRYYMVNELYGFHRRNIEDPTERLILSTITSDPNRNDPNFVNVLGTQTIWPRTGFTIPAFDADGTLWTLREPGGENAVELWRWTKDDRLAVQSGADYNAHPMKSYRVEHAGDFRSHYSGNLVPCVHEKNRNLFGYVSNTYGDEGFFYDNNGTPDDTSDDLFVDFSNLIDQNGDHITDSEWPAVFFEDPVDGAMIVGCEQGMFVTSREEIFGEKHRVNWLYAAFDNGSGLSERILGENNVYAITADPNGRKWIATEKDGIFCLSADRSTVLAHYTTENSPLPDNEVMSLVWNPDRGSLWAGTMLGALEFFPEGTEMHAGNIRPAASPRTLNRDYRGHVFFTGLADSKTYRLLDADGIEVATIIPHDGKAQWDPAGAKAGVYTLDLCPDLTIFINY